VKLSEHIQKLREDLKEGKFTSEAAVSQGILLPTLHVLGWPVFDTSIVMPEYTVEGRRVDYALCNPPNKPYVFIEVKKIGLSDGADRQLFEYAFHLGVPIAILTDGQEWSFYLPGEQGRYDERRVYKLDILERNVSEAEQKLKSYLSYENICSGKALEAARADYRNVARKRIIKANLPKAWEALLKEQDSLLLELLSEKVEDICGYKPDLDTCSNFLKNQVVRDNIIQPTTREKHLPSSQLKLQKSGHATSHLNSFSFVYNGEEITARSARDLMTKIFRFLHKEDNTFFERFASRKHGRKRRYLSHDKYELYPGRPDLAERHSIEIASGWWLGTNYSRKNIKDIINLALEVAGPRLREAIKVNFE